MVLDVDGVLTDAGIYYDAEGRILKRFNVQDGLGIKLAQREGLTFAVITGLDQPAVAARVRELGITDYSGGHLEKMPFLTELVERKGLTFDEVAYLGDDWIDAKPLRAVGMPMAVANAQPEIKTLAAWISEKPGGQGAVREAISFILRAQGKYEEMWRAWSE
ncbi:3-deoxy-D-manno-octulosonate 8-phosphate phosphatase, YrbI family [Desulfovibrio sp. X2]|uniref:KdsC family phosphatase n=1 Tax=Desulfovibrio sp. X2 TaxID=941449 RepID=UPI000358EF61|nr:HAD-IIIA family hydrolase [Desulfovibrio sp. X2]EPR42195.1 3-deoxy-D-manno-octulosonate 8-phosphate phosphatase, YrbI family [Desulfovibrio sp. X2]